LKMLRRLIALPVLLLATACAPDWSAQESPKTNQVSYTQFRHDVEFSGNADQPTTEELQRLATFMERIALGYGDQVRIAAGGPLDRRRAAAIAASLKRRGIASELAAGDSPPGRVSVAIGRHVVTPPSCPDWSRRSESDFTNLASANFGCANAANLGLMVADPGDLVRGRSAPTADGEAAVLAIQRYRAGKTRPLAEGDTQGGGGGK